MPKLKYRPSLEWPGLDDTVDVGDLVSNGVLNLEAFSVLDDAPGSGKTAGFVHLAQALIPESKVALVLYRQSTDPLGA